MKLLLILLLIIYYFSINIAHEIIQSDCHLQKRIVGHFSNAPNMKNITAKEMSMLTHFIYNQIDVNELGQLYINKPSVLLQITQIARNIPTLKIMVNLKELSKSIFTNIFAKQETRRSLIENIISFLKQNDLHGINIDWPDMNPRENHSIKENYILFLKELSNSLDRKYLLSINSPYTQSLYIGPEITIIYDNDNTEFYKKHVSLALHKPDLQLERGYDLLKISEYVDFINVMSHGYFEPGITIQPYTGPNAPIYKNKDTDVDPAANVDSTARYYACSIGGLEKINIVLPLYAYYYKNILDETPRWNTSNLMWLSSFNDEYRNWNTWRQLFPYYNLNQTVYDEATRSSYLYDKKRRIFYGVENLRALQEKINYAFDHNIGGFYLLAVDYDDDNDTVLDYVTSVIQEKICADLLSTSSVSSWAIFICDNGNRINLFAKKFRNLLLVLSIIGIILLIFVSFIITIYCLLNRKERKKQMKLLSNINQGKILHLEQNIGQGHFGTVYKGTWDGEVIAAKLFKTCPEIFQCFSNEFLLLTELQNENLCKFFAATFYEEHEIALIYEYANLGNLQEFLQQNGPTNDKIKRSIFPIYYLNNLDLINIAKMIAKGLNYLFSKNIIHRDLSARNCLVFENTKSNLLINQRSNITVKISDFGLAKIMKYTQEKLHETGYNLLCFTKKDNILLGENLMKPAIIKAKFAWRWCAPETLRKNIFSKKTDIWSYGVLLYEIFSFGMLPYGDIRDAQIMVIRSKIMTGKFQLEIPSKTPPSIEMIMKACWHINPNERIGIEEIRRRLKGAQDDLFLDSDSD